jgi:hypothetical protein
MSGSPIIGGEYSLGDGVARKLFVFGVHLRGGTTDQTDAGCGSLPGTNVDITLPADAIELVPR